MRNQIDEKDWDEYIVTISKSKEIIGIGLVAGAVVNMSLHTVYGLIVSVVGLACGIPLMILCYSKLKKRHQQGQERKNRKKRSWKKKGSAEKPEFQQKRNKMKDGTKKCFLGKNRMTDNKWESKLTEIATRIREIREITASVRKDAKEKPYPVASTSLEGGTGFPFTFIHKCALPSVGKHQFP